MDTPKHNSQRHQQTNHRAGHRGGGGVTQVRVAAFEGKTGNLEKMNTSTDKLEQTIVIISEDFVHLLSQTKKNDGWFVPEDTSWTVGSNHNLSTSDIDDKSFRLQVKEDSKKPPIVSRVLEAQAKLTCLRHESVSQESGHKGLVRQMHSVRSESSTFSPYMWRYQYSCADVEIPLSLSVRQASSELQSRCLVQLAV